MLDGIMGGAGVANLIPGGQVLGVVAMGLELAKGLFDKGDMKGAEDALKFLNEVVSQLGTPGGQATEAMPFTNPALPGRHNMVNAQTLENQNFMQNSRRSIDITIDITPGGGASNAQPAHYGYLPATDGSVVGDLQMSKNASTRVDGSGANVDRALKPGSNEWTTVMWAMYKNPNVRYNADTKEFTLKMSDGSDRKLGTLEEAQKAIGSAGYDRQHPVGADNVGNFLQQRQNEVLQNDGPSSAGPSDDISKLVDQLKKLLQQFEEAQKSMQQSTIDVSINQAVA